MTTDTSPKRAGDLDAAVRVLSELVARLESATGPDRELDVAIYEAVRGCLHVFQHEFVDPADDSDDLDTQYRCTKCGFIAKQMSVPYIAYTRSLDAVLTLVPEGHYVSHLGEELKFNGWYARIKNWNQYGMEGADIPDWTSVNKHPAIALCIAALKARDTQARAAAPNTPSSVAAKD